MTAQRLLTAIGLICMPLILATACDGSITFGDGITGSGDLVTETYDLDGFDAISVENAFEVDVIIGETTSVEVVVDDNLIDELDVRVHGDELVVSLRDGVSVRNATLEAVLTLPELVSVDVSGASRVEAVGVDTDTFELDVSGASRVEVVGSTGTLDVDASGASDVMAVGSARTVAVDASGASNVDLDLEGVGQASIDASGASNVELADAELVTGELSGASNLTAPEGAEVDMATSGGSDVERG